MLDRLRDRAGELLRALAAESYALRSRATRQPRLAEVLERQESLLRLDRVAEVQREMAGTTGEAERAARFLLEFLAEARALRAACASWERLRTWELNASASLGETTFGMDEVPDLLAESSDPAVRRAVVAAWLAEIEDVEPAVQVILDREREVTGELGYGDRVQAAEVLGGIELRALAAEGEELLSGTEPLYRDLLAHFLPRLAGVSLAEATEADLERLRRAEPLDPSFPAPRMSAGVLRELSASGLDPVAGGRLRIDERAAGSTPRAAFHQVLDVPESVVVSVAPAGGRRVHDSFLFALGAGLHRAHTAPDLPLEFRWLGDRSVTAAFGELFRGLLSLPAWLARVQAVPRKAWEEHRRLAALLGLMEVRRDVALLRYELERAREGDAPEAYPQLLGEALLVSHDARGRLVAALPTFESARRLRGRALEALLAPYLRDRFDEDWFRNPRAGPALEALLAHGRRYTAAELAIQTTSTPLSLRHLAARLGEIAG